MFPDNISSDVPHLVDLNTQTEFAELKKTRSLRSAVDRVTNPPNYLAGLRGTTLRAFQLRFDTSEEARQTWADDMRRELERLRRGESYGQRSVVMIQWRKWTKIRPKFLSSFPMRW